MKALACLLPLLISLSSGTIISSVDHNAVPEGETITFTGSGFSGTTDVNFLYGGFYGSSSQSINVIDDSVLEASFNAWQTSRDHVVLIRSPQGCTISLPEGIDEFTTSGVLTRNDVDSNSGYVIAKSGSVITDVEHSDLKVLYLESGSVLQDLSSISSETVILAEDGAVIDFRNQTVYCSIFYTPNTTIIGSISTSNDPLSAGDTIIEQVPSVSYSPGIATFTSGCLLEIQSDGSGTITVTPEKEFYELGDIIQVSATPASGNLFIRWLNDITSLEDSLTITLNGDCKIGARFSDRPAFFTTWRSGFFTSEEITDLSIVGLDEDPDNDGISNIAEYSFGTNPRVGDQNTGISFQKVGSDTKSLEVSYIRPINASDLYYYPLVSQDMNNWHDGKEGALLYSFSENSLVPIDDEFERVTYQLSFDQDISNSLFFRISADLD